MPAKHLTQVYETAANLAANNEVYPTGWAIHDEYGRVKYGNSVDTYTELAGGTARGTTPVSTVQINEFGDGRDITTVLTLTDFIVGAIPSANAALGVGNIVYAFPAGAHLELAYYFSLALKLPGAGVACDTGIGSVIASGAVSVLSGTGTFEDRVTGQAVTSAAAGGTAVAVGPIGATAGILTGISLNDASKVKNVFLNAAGTFATTNAGNLTATGTISIKWTRMSA